MLVTKFFAVMFLLGASKQALTSSLSDMEYLRSKVAETVNTMEEKEENSDGEEEAVEEEEGDEDPVPPQHTDSAYESGENLSKTKSSVPCKKKESKMKKSEKQEVNTSIQYYCTVIYIITVQWCFVSALRVVDI